jgi:negative regulator of flagellin synthesis FlgM
MEITGKSHFPQLDAYNRTLRDNKTVGRRSGKDESTLSAATGLETTDDVSISAQVDKVRTLAAQLTDLPEVREDKVAELKRQIDAGTYNPSGNDIAFSMLKEAIVNELS